MDTRGGTGPGELVAALSAIKEAIERHCESRFRDLDDTSERRVPMRDLLGYRFMYGKNPGLKIEGFLVWGFTAAGWREVLSGVADPKGIARMLADQNALITAKSDRSHRLMKKIDGRSIPLFTVKQSALDAAVEVKDWSDHG